MCSLNSSKYAFKVCKHWGRGKERERKNGEKGRKNGKKERNSNKSH
jgi:hypothetical protein